MNSALSFLTLKISSFHLNLQAKKLISTIKNIYTTDELVRKLELSISKNHFKFSNSKDRETTAKELVQFLYKIGFITARKVDRKGKIVRKTFEENKYLSSPDLNFSFSWEVHPAYRWALEPDDFNAIYEKLDIETEWE